MKKTVESLITNWNYDEAVSDLKARVEDWGKRTLICARALYVANVCLSASGTRTDLVQNGTRLPDKPQTFEAMIGISIFVLELELFFSE